MERRIFGLENEYGVTCTLRGQRRLSPDEVARYLFRRVVSFDHDATSSYWRRAAMPREEWLFTAPRLTPMASAMSASDRSR